MWLENVGDSWVDVEGSGQKGWVGLVGMVALVRGRHAALSPI